MIWTMFHSAQPNAPLRLYLILTGLTLVLHLLGFGTLSTYLDPRTGLWSLAAAISYAAIYLLPTLLLLSLLNRRKQQETLPRHVKITAIVLGGLTQTLLFSDHLIYKMYGFHINGFVLDLVFAPGGIASLGASRSTELTASLIVLGFFALQTALFWLSEKFCTAPFARQLKTGVIVALIIVLGIGERIGYGFSHAANYQPILFASEQYPLYLPLTFRKLANKLGISSEKQTEGANFKPIDLSYPLNPLVIEKPEKPLNIVWLVSESLRFDMLDSKIMPKTWAFSQESGRFEQHFSGGNLTQMGVFSMFYGLYGNYWFPMLAARRAPVLMDVLQAQNYQFSLYTSQRFTYPAFDKTILVKMRPEDLHELSGGPPPWQRDIQNIDQMLQFIDGRDTSRPFMTYMFFESTHANYDFPESAVIAKPYLEDLNYITADFSRDISLIKNRYINAAHHVDSQIGRVIDHLREKKLLENTIVIVLGDHGEEFMERKRWGHSAEFNRFQVSTPAVIHMPGETPRVVKTLSSHLDIPATLLPRLGVKNPPEDYSQGTNLFAPDFQRRYAVAADWNRVAYIGPTYRMTFPYNATGAVKNEVTDGDDRPVQNEEAVRDAIRPETMEIMKNLTRFSRQVGK